MGGEAEEKSVQKSIPGEGIRKNGKREGKSFWGGAEPHKQGPIGGEEKDMGSGSERVGEKAVKGGKRNSIDSHALEQRKG